MTPDKHDTLIAVKNLTLTAMQLTDALISVNAPCGKAAKAISNCLTATKVLGLAAGLTLAEIRDAEENKITELCGGMAEVLEKSGASPGDLADFDQRTAAIREAIRTAVSSP